MSQQSSRFFASRKGWLGAGIAAAAVVVVAQLGFDFPVAKDVMGTVAPAQRYRAAPNGSEDVKLGAPSGPAGSTTAMEASRSDAEKTADLTAQKKAEMTADLKAQKAVDLTAQQAADLRVQQSAEMTAQKSADKMMQRMDSNAHSAEKTTADRTPQ